MITLLISSFIVLAYFLLIYTYIRGWNNIPVFKAKNDNGRITISVLIAFRNEESRLPELFNALEHQTYPQISTEIIFVNDHSDDRSAFLAQEFIAGRPNAKLINLGALETGKKKALANASAEAHGELLIFTDADCIPGKDWINTVVAFYRESDSVLIASPVIMESGKSFFSRFQSLEFFSLIASTAGSFGINRPIMVNGANLAIKRDVYLENISFIENRATSGDDIFLLLQLKRKYPGKLSFLKSTDAIVQIKPETGIFAFFQQRLRWVSKSKYYNDSSVIIAAILVLLMNLWLLNCLVMSFFAARFIYIGGGVLLVKTIIDFIFLKKVLGFFNKKRLLNVFVLSQFLYFLYISFTGIAGNLIVSKWKGRAVK